MTSHDALTLLAAVTLAGCAQPAYRGDSYRTKELDALLEFLHEPDASRASVEARIGLPRASFEEGRVSAYGVWEHRPWNPGPVLTEGKPTYTIRCDPPRKVGCSEAPRIQLMIEYDASGKVRRYNVIETR